MHTITYKWVKYPQLNKAQILFKCQRESFLFENKYPKDPLYWDLLAVVDQVHGSGSVMRFLPGSGSATLLIIKKANWLIWQIKTNRHPLPITNGKSLRIFGVVFFHGTTPPVTRSRIESIFYFATRIGARDSFCVMNDDSVTFRQSATWKLAQRFTSCSWNLAQRFTLRHEWWRRNSFHAMNDGA